MIIREIHIDDADHFSSLVKEVEDKADFMLMEPGERQMTVEQQRERLTRMMQEDQSTIFVAEIDGRLVGYLIAIGSNVKRTRHTAYLVIGILEKYRGQGIGTALFNNLDIWAKKHNLSRLELTTVTVNKAGIALYKKCGFQIEGTKRKSLQINDKFYDEYYMSKLIDGIN